MLNLFFEVVENVTHFSLALVHELEPLLHIVCFIADLFAHVSYHACVASHFFLESFDLPEHICFEISHQVKVGNLFERDVCLCDELFWLSYFDVLGVCVLNLNLDLGVPRHRTLESLVDVGEGYAVDHELALVS